MLSPDEAQGGLQKPILRLDACLWRCPVQTSRVAEERKKFLWLIGRDLEAGRRIFLRDRASYANLDVDFGLVQRSRAGYRMPTDCSQSCRPIILNTVYLSQILHRYSMSAHKEVI